MQDTVDSVREYGVLVPAIARPDPDGGYELIAGHRRHHASELAGKETMPGTEASESFASSSYLPPSCVQLIFSNRPNTITRPLVLASAQVDRPITCAGLSVVIFL